jgi:hypothetical protein
MAEVVNREADPLVRHSIMFVHLEQQHGHQSRLPIVTVDDVRALIGLQHKFESGLAEKGASAHTRRPFATKKAFQDRTLEIRVTNNPESTHLLSRCALMSLQWQAPAGCALWIGDAAAQNPLRCGAQLSTLRCKIALATGLRLTIIVQNCGLPVHARQQRSDTMYVAFVTLMLVCS